MATYNVNLTAANSEHGSLIEPDSNYNGYDYFSIGNNDSGSARFLLLRLPLGVVSGTVNSAILTLPAYNNSNQNSSSLSVKVSPVTGSWSQSTEFDTSPAYNSGVVDLRTFNETLPSSSNYDYRTGYHAARYKYKKYEWADIPEPGVWVYVGDVYFSSYVGSTYYSGGYKYVYDSTIAAYYDTYVKYRTIDITDTVQYLIDNGYDSILIYFTLPGTNSTRKYFKSPINTNSSLQPTLAVDYTADPAPTAPTLGTIGTVTNSPHTFDWSDAVDESGNFTPEQLYYELQISGDGGANWSAIQTTAQGTSEISLDLYTYIGIVSGQYYLNSNFKIRVRTKTPDYGGVPYYSSWVTSAVFTVDYRLTPTAPTLTPSDTDPYEGEAITFTLDRPATYNAYKENGDGNTLDYRVELSSGTLLENGVEAVTSASKVLNYTVEELTSAKADLSTNIRANCVDGNSLVGAYCANQAFTIKRFRAPIVQIAKITRNETTAVVDILIADTGYGASQSNSQINKVQYDIGSGYVDASLGSWTGLTNSFTISSLDADTPYSLSIRAVNNAPSGTALSDLTGSATTDTITEFRPAFAVLKDGTSGDRIVYVRKLLVGEDDEATPVDSIAGADCWIDASETWTYASANTITVPSGAVSKYQAGDMFKLTANSVELQGYIVDVADTLLTVSGDTLTNHSFSENYYARPDCPMGFDCWFPVTPTFGGLDDDSGGQPTINEFRFSINGKKVTAHFNISGYKVGSGRYFWFADSDLSPLINRANYSGRTSVGHATVYYSGGIELPANIIHYSGDNYFYIIVETSILDGTQIIEIGGTITYEI